MEISAEISKWSGHKYLSAFRRKVVYSDPIEDKVKQTYTFNFRVVLMDDNGVPLSEDKDAWCMVNDYGVPRVADNSTPVDSSGRWLLKEDGTPDWENPDAVGGEYDFLTNAALMYPVPTLARAGIAQIDAAGGFNIKSPR